MRKRRFFLVILSSLLILVGIGTAFFPYFVQAKEKLEQESTFAYRLDYPENQILPVDYYYLKVSPNQRQELSMILKNPTKKSMMVDVSFHQAWTNSQGFVDYSQPPKSEPSQEVEAMEKMVEIPSEVELPAQSEKKITLLIHMPQESFDGILLGGIQLKKRNKEEPVEKKAGMQIKNDYLYTIALALRETEVQTPEKFEWKGLEAQSGSSKVKFTTTIANQTTNIVSDMRVNVEIMSQENDQVISEIGKDSISFAPQSSFTYPFSVDREKLPKGKYRAKVILRQNEQKMGEWLSPFEIKDDVSTADRNSQTIHPKGSFSLKKWVGKMIAILFGIGFVLFIFIHQINRKISRKK